MAQGCLQRDQFAGDFVADLPLFITVVNVEVALEQVDDRQIGGGLAIGGRRALQQEPALRARSLGELVEETGLADPRFPDDRHHLAVPSPSLFQRLVQGRELRLPPHKGVNPRAANVCRRIRTGPAPTSSHTSMGAGNPLTGTRPKGVTWTHPSTSRRVSAVSRMVPGGASCSIRAARWVVWPIAE